MNIYEFDLPDDVYVNPEDVLSQFLNSLMLNDQVNLMLIIEKSGWIGKLSNKLKVVLPSDFDALGDNIGRLSMAGFNLFVFSASTLTGIENLFRSVGYHLSDPVIDITSIPIPDTLFEQVLEFSKNMRWEGSIIFFSHDGYPAFVFRTDDEL